VRKPLSLVSLAVFLILVGCASQQDLKRVHAELDQKIAAVDQKAARLEQEDLKRQEALAVLTREVGQNRDDIAAVRKVQASQGADMTELRDQVQQLRGTVEGLQKDVAVLSGRAGRKDEEVKDLRERLDAAAFKVNFVENFLGIGKKEDRSENGDRSGKSVRESLKGKTDKDSLYALAYETFKEGRYEKAREEFQNFLKAYPATEYSDNAQFWIGECYYLERKYEKAILEYEKVVKGYPEGDRAPHALLKQGLCFQSLGDQSSARLILQQVIRAYPNTSSARIARAKLMEIK